MIGSVDSDHDFSLEEDYPPNAPTLTLRVNPGRFSTLLVVLSVFYVPIGRLWDFPYCYPYWKVIHSFSTILLSYPQVEVII